MLSVPLHDLAKAQDVQAEAGVGPIDIPIDRPAGGLSPLITRPQADAVQQSDMPNRDESPVGQGNQSSGNRPSLFSLSIGDSTDPDDLAPALRVVGLITLLTFAPALLLLMSSFTRILLVLSFLRQAIGVPTMPPNQVLVGLALFMSYFVSHTWRNRLVQRRQLTVQASPYEPLCSGRQDQTI
jgi:flagellar biosynthesis protein FliP